MVGIIEVELRSVKKMKRWNFQWTLIEIIINNQRIRFWSRRAVILLDIAGNWSWKKFLLLSKLFPVAYPSDFLHTNSTIMKKAFYCGKFRIERNVIVFFLPLLKLLSVSSLFSFLNWLNFQHTCKRKKKFDKKLCQV